MNKKFNSEASEEEEASMETRYDDLVSEIKKNAMRQLSTRKSEENLSTPTVLQREFRRHFENFKREAQSLLTIGDLIFNQAEDNSSLAPIYVTLEQLNMGNGYILSDKQYEEINDESNDTEK